MKWRRKPARPVLAVSRAKHKANSQSLSEASNNEAYKYAFKINHCRGVARKTFRSGEGGLTPSLSRGGPTDISAPAETPARDRRGSIRLRTEATARHAERARQGGWTDAAWRDPTVSAIASQRRRKGTSHISILCDPNEKPGGRNTVTIARIKSDMWKCRRGFPLRSASYEGQAGQAGRALKAWGAPSRVSGVARRAKTEPSISEGGHTRPRERSERGRLKLGNQQLAPKRKNEINSILSQ